MTYESIKQCLANARGASPTTPLAVVIAGGLCGLVSWACVSFSSIRLVLPSAANAEAKIFPIDTAKSIYQRNCLISGRDKANRPKIQFFNPRMYRGTVSIRPRCLHGSVLRSECCFLFGV
jgi:solute carrier family 25 carnitine/acylcarnitine transporter 20/29